MDRVQLREQVRQAIGQEWATFEAAHPHLAAAVDQELLVNQAMASLADDPAYCDALASAQAAGMVVGALGPLRDMVTRLVRDWLRALG